MESKLKLGYHSIIVVVIFQIFCSGQAQNSFFPAGNSERNNNRESNGNPRSGTPNFVDRISTNAICGAVEWPKENHVAGPYVSEPIFSKLCLQRTGKFESTNSCEEYVLCQNGCLTFNRCPSSQVFNPSAQSCVAASEYQCSKRDSINKIQENPRNTPHDSNLIAQNNEKIILSHPPMRNSIENLELSKLRAVPASQNQIDCREEQVGLFAHPTSCESYIECANGNHLTKRCPPGTAFNPDLSLCDWKQNVPECNTEINGSGAVSFKNINNKLRERSQNFHGNNVNRERSLRSPAASKSCTASENYVEPHPEYCNKYQVCSNGKLFTEVCGPGTLFDPLNSVCNFPDRVDCESRKADLGTYGCQKQHTYRTSHWEFCNQFVECDKGILAIKTCPSGLVYDVENSNCDYSHKVECRKPISLEHDTDVNAGHSGPSRSIRSVANYACDFNYIAPHPRCNKFVECEEKTLFVKSCGPGTVYNRIIGQCDWAYNTREPNEGDCKSYQECSGGEMKQRLCRGNLLFNPTTKSCDRPDNVNCQTTELPVPAESK